MKTRYTSLVSVKKNSMQKSEQVLQSANAAFKSAQKRLALSFKELIQFDAPSSGLIADFLSPRMLLDAQRSVIEYNETALKAAEQEIERAKAQLKIDMIEFEKFNYLELQEIKEIQKKQKYQEAKELDEIALMTYERKRL